MNVNGAVKKTGQIRRSRDFSAICGVLQKTERGTEMKVRIKEWFSIQLVKRPGTMVLAAILLFNIVFFLLAALIISSLSLDGTEKMGFVEAAVCTITMILDAGCIQFVVEDIGKAGIGITLVCLAVVLIGMISFTGSVIGYVTNYISHFIENANAGKRKLHLDDHFVILNWNSRASEIINDMLYSDEKQKVVVLVQSRREAIEKEIDERLADTITRENNAVANRYKSLPWLSRHIMIHKNRFKSNVTVMVREGDIFSSKQLNDISLKAARAVIILGNDINNTVCKFEQKERQDEGDRGSAQTIKTLMQVSDITADESSADNQKIVVEITDAWTLELVNKIIAAKQVEGKCNIIPVKVNEVLGQVLSQFCLMPELNSAYSELFSNRGAEFHSEERPYEDEIKFASEYFKNHNHALPITTMKNGDKSYTFYVTDNSKDIHKKSAVTRTDYSVSLKKDYWMERKNVVILGHNSKCRHIMAGFVAFSNEWKRGSEEIVRIVVIDDKKNLEKQNYYKEYPFVIKTVEADIYDKDKICSAISDFISENEEDTSILILSDDSALNEDIDASALANLVYVRDIVSKKLEENPQFDVESVDVIVEIIDPKHHDIVSSYSVNNVVISNRYISKMITQISEFEALFDFYNDILSYDEDSTDEYSSKEVYIKKVRRYFDEIPKATTADQLVRAIYEASIDEKRMGVQNPTIALGYVKPGGIVEIFGGDLTQIKVELDEKDKLVLFSAH